MVNNLVKASNISGKESSNIIYGKDAYYYISENVVYSISFDGIKNTLYTLPTELSSQVISIWDNPNKFWTGDKNGIANQTKTVVAGGNDAAAIHKAAGGIKTVAVSLPCRYIHSASSVGSKKDMESVKALCEVLLEEFANG